MQLVVYDRKFSVQKNATWRVRVILSQSYRCGYHDYDCDIYLEEKFY